jgi:hypothetical protein
MTKVVISGGFVKIGCIDPLATNYDPTATEGCVDCCTYKAQVTGCRDPLATNYNPLATADCTTPLCCTYTATDVFNGGGGFTGFVGVGTGTSNLVDLCPGPFSITLDGEVLGVSSAECCDATVIGRPTPGYDYFWDGKHCFLKTNCPTDLTCITCDTFDWWNDTYIVNHSGQGLQESEPILWQQLVDVISNSGQTVYVQTSTGNLLDEICCNTAKGVFRDGICFCETPIEETYEPRCISNLTEFLDFISIQDGYNFFLANFSTIGSLLGLTSLEVNFIKANILNTADINSNTIPDDVEAKLILSNALNATGGFYVNFGTSTGTPAVVSQSTCNTIGGFWGNLSTTRGNVIVNNLNGGQCMCKPLVNQCVIDITEVETTNILDFYNNPIQVVTKDGTPIGEACCNRLIKDYNLPWVWQGSYCYATPKDDCLPVLFTLNDKPMEVSCETDLEISLWVYFGTPDNPCQPIIGPPDNDIIIIEGEACAITLTPNTGVVVANTGGGTPDVVTATGFAVGLGGLAINTGEIPTAPPKVCCYNNLNPILAKISVTDPILNSYLVQVTEYNSNANYFDTWVQLKATLPTSGLTLNFGVNLEIYQGLNCCCKYDIFVDDIRVDCAKQESLLIINDIQCPGFELTRVIDNKKSWVYNPGTPEVGISEYDNIERADGSFGMLNGEGIVNRTFAPSLDADLPWRYTDYFKQSSVYETHSNLVLNTKELGLTFDMCADCPISGTTLGCPDGYTLSAGTTNVCYMVTTCDCYEVKNPDTKVVYSATYTDCSGTTQNVSVAPGLSAQVCSSDLPTDPYKVLQITACAVNTCDNIVYTSPIEIITITYLNLFQLENYKKTFQSF